MLKRTNVEEKLKRAREEEMQMEKLLHEVQQLLQNHQSADTPALRELESGENVLENHFDYRLLEADRIYHRSQIRKICIDYRLRFLPSRYFKGRFPRKTLETIKSLEREHQTTVKGYHIMAPSKMFKLDNADDPLLFAPISEDYYYLIDKWGNDLHPLRKWLVRPFRDLSSLLVLLLCISFLVTLLIPKSIFSPEPDTTTFWLLYFFVVKMIGSIMIFYGFALGKNFNYAIWNSHYFNA